jgi:hypothetical protein
VVVVAVVAGVGSGCYCSHERSEETPVAPDAGRDGGAPPRDVPILPPPMDVVVVPPPRDAGPTDGTWWTLDPVPVTFQLRCQYFAGTSAIIDVVPSATSPCQSPGPVVVAMPVPVPPRGSDWTVHAYLWTQHGAACAGPAMSLGQAIRLLSVPAGEHRLIDAASMTSSTFRVFEAPSPDCTGPLGDGVECQRDCDCESGTCAAISGDAWCASFCGRPCRSDGDCAPGDVCTASDIGDRCAARVVPECATDAECPMDWSCDASGAGAPFCRWSTAPPGNPPCRFDGDCPSGFSCIEDPDTGERACGIRCSDIDMPCPGGRECVPGLFGSTLRWTCGPWEP